MLERVFETTHFTPIGFKGSFSSEDALEVIVAPYFYALRQFYEICFSSNSFLKNRFN
jgi:hypothetical protein